MHGTHHDDDVPLEERHRTEREYFDTWAEQNAEGVVAREIDESMIPRNMAKYVDVLSRFVMSRGDADKMRVLELGCGAGIMTILLARRGFHVTALDLSPKLVELVQRVAERNGVADRVEVLEGAAEHLPVPDESYDVVVGTKMLHHVSIPQTSKELHRVLKPGGGAFFWECTYKNPLINVMRNAARAMPSYKITGTPFEHPLTREEIGLLASAFGGNLKLYAAPFAFFSHLALVLTRGESKSAMAFGERVDRVLETVMPFLKNFAVHQILEMRREEEGVRAGVPVAVPA